MKGGWMEDAGFGDFTCGEWLRKMQALERKA